ncbi:hypothetical protein LIER_43306 [Lithospermum erythrorhizon]|uniref:Alpha/beta hydrolase fold-3 domain-containing protein n=1 Tax=Lithospermum erythrorhizon TaxID=34254 RepID=A0AAV3PTS6_LITER
MASSSTNDIVLHIPSVIKVYKDGKVERFWGTTHVPPSHDPTTGVSSKDITILPHVSARGYLPKVKSNETKLAVLVYYHAGAFCLGSAFSVDHHRYLNTLASEANCLAVSVEYRLAVVELGEVLLRWIHLDTLVYF